MRKQPQQVRSRALVERIVAAAREVLTNEGYEGLTTNRVAIVAGVSPGSLYQYFANKAAIVDVVIERYSDEITDQVTNVLTDGIRNRSQPRLLVPKVTDALLSALETNPGLLRVIVEELPQARSQLWRLRFEHTLQTLLATILLSEVPTPGRDDPSLTSWVLMTAIEGLSIRWALDVPGYDRDQFIREVGELVLGQLERRSNRASI